MVRFFRWLSLFPTFRKPLQGAPIRSAAQYNFAPSQRRAARKAAFLATFVGFGLATVQHAQASDFYAQLESAATGSSIGFTAYPAVDRVFIDKMRIYASVPIGNSVAVTAWGLVAGGGASMGTVYFPTSTTSDPAYYEISGGGFSYPVCSSIFPTETFCIEYFTASGDSYLLGTVINNNFYAYLELADSADALNPVSVVPLVPALGQYKSDGVTPIAEGGTTSGDTLVLTGALQSSSTDQLQLEVEVEPFGIPFTNAATAASSPVASGQTASAKVTVLSDGYYHWQARAVDAVTGAATDWREFGIWGNTDFVVDTAALGSSAAYNFQDQSGDIGTDNGRVGYTGPLSLSIRLGKPSAAPTNATVQFYQNGTTGCADPGYSFQGYTDGTFATPDGPGLGLGNYTDASGTPISLRDYNGIVKATVFGTFNVNDYYAFSFGSCDFSRPVSIKGNAAGKYACTQPGGPFGLYCYSAFYAGANPYLIVSGLPASSFGATSTTINPTLSTNEPINTATGNYYLSRTDLTVPGKGTPFAFTRSYNSLDSYSGPLGAGWTHSYNILLNDSGTAVTIKEADGHSVQFAATGGGGYVPSTPGLFDALQKNADATYTLTRKNQTQVNFTAAGKLSTIIDRNGNTQTLGYDSSGNLVSVLDSSGRAYAFTNDGSGRITSVSDPAGRSWQYAYDPNGNLMSARDAAGGVTQYAYDASHRMTSATDPRGVTYLQNVFDSLGRVITQTNARGSATTLAYGSPVPGTTTFTDPLGNATQHVYDGNLRIVKVVDAKGGVISYAYDANNDRTSVTNQNGKTTSFAYDSNGNVTAITDPLADITTFTYDAKNDLLSATNPKGNATTFSYDANGNLIAIKDPLGNTTAFAYNGAGLPVSKTDARGNTTAFSYDASGNLVQIKDAFGNATNLAYDAIGRLTSLTDARNHTASSSYDALSRIVMVTDPLGDQTQFAYDPLGNLVTITDANGHATAYAYDGTNNLVTVTDAAGNVTRYAYDPNNNRTGFTNAKGNTTSYSFDQLNRLNAITDALSFVTSYAYDLIGNVVSTTDANGKTNQFSYDALNRLIAVAYADGTSVAYAYDPDGDRTSMADSHGTTQYTYDALDRLTSVIQPGSNAVQYAYDPVGNRNSLTYPDGKIVGYAYDRANRLVSATDWLAKTTSYSYDAVSNLIQTTYPNRAGNAYAYDAANRLTQVVNSAFGIPLLTSKYTLDKVGNRTALSVDGVTTSYAYDALNELLSTQLGPLKTTWTYDQVGNRIKQTSPLGATAYAYDADDRLLTAGTAAFSFDNDGNLISKTDHKTTVNYTYDAANRLIHATGPGVSSSFAYDGDGNRVSQSTASGTYGYVNDVATALPVVLAEQGPDGALTYAYGLGLIEVYNPAFSYFYHYDGLGSVIALTDAKGIPAAAYAYDAWGNALLTIPNTVGTRNKFRFTGEALDPATGLYYLRARYQDPGTGRFLTRDPHLGLVSSPLSQNRYINSLNNPLRYADHSGLNPMEMASHTNTSVVGLATTGLFRTLRNWWDVLVELATQAAQTAAPSPIISPTDVANFGSVWAASEIQAHQSRSVADPSEILTRVEDYLLAGNTPDQAIHNTFVNAPLSPLDNQKYEQELSLLLKQYYDPNAHNDLHLTNEAAMRQDWITWYNGTITNR